MEILEMFDRLLEKLNILPKQLIDGQYIAFCSLVSNIAHELVALKRDTAKLLAEKNEQIEKCKAMIDAQNNALDEDEKKGTAENGSN